MYSDSPCFCAAILPTTEVPQATAPRHHGRRPPAALRAQRPPTTAAADAAPRAPGKAGENMEKHGICWSSLRKILGNSFWQYGTQQKSVKGSVRNRSKERSFLFDKDILSDRMQQHETCEAKKINFVDHLWYLGAHGFAVLREQNRTKL